VIVNLHRDDWSPDRRGLRALRSVRTPSVHKGARSSAYTAGLIQADEMWDAAASVTSLASPILRYYALVQASLSVSAASPLGNHQWQPAPTHGLTLEIKDAPLTSLAQVQVKESAGRGVAQTLSRALGSPLLTRPVSLVELIGAIPGQSLLSNREDWPPRALECDGMWVSRDHNSELTISPLPPSLSLFRVDDAGLRHAVTPSREQVRALLERYPSLSGLPDPDGCYANPNLDGGDGHSLHLSWHSGLMPEWKEWARYFGIWTLPQGLGASQRAVALPRVAGNDTVQHPLVTWFVVLFAFSMLARYHADAWRRLLDVDRSRDALLLEEVVDSDSRVALQLVELAIEQFARRADCAE